MLLRESSRALGQGVNIEAVMNAFENGHDGGVEDRLNGSRQWAEGGNCSGDDPFGFPAATDLLRFATAANRYTNLHESVGSTGQPGDDHLAALTTARAGLVAAVGTEGTMEAAATVAIFNGLVRVADGTGIQLDGALTSASSTLRDELGLNTMAGAANTPDALDAPSPEQATGDESSTVAGLFAD